jgi:glycyl-tRNA synthetase alpha subunit
LTPNRLAEPLLRWFVERGCARLAAADAPVTHGVLAPEVFFSLLGREPWRSVHLQPVRRPRDSRPRLHPHRLAVHHQVYAVLGSGELEPLELVLGLLRSIRLDPSGHDLRLLARDTGVPLAGVEASGWAIVVDWVDVGRVSWLATVGGQPLAEPVLEVALGLERLSMIATEEAADGPGASRRLRAWEEEELATHCLEVADAERLGQRFEALVAEAGASLDAGLLLTAHRALLEAAQVAQVLELRVESVARHDDLERRVAAGIARCARAGVERHTEPGTGEVA